MKSGELKHSVQVQSKSTSTGDRGQAVVTWNLLATVPASLEPLSGRKLEIARQLVATATHEIKLRYLSTLTPRCRIVFGSRVFSIGNINNVKELNFEQVITAIEEQ